MTDYNNNSGGWYHHDNAENCIKFQAKVKMLARSHTNKDVIKILKGDTVTAADDRRVRLDIDICIMYTRNVYHYNPYPRGGVQHPGSLIRPVVIRPGRLARPTCRCTAPASGDPSRVPSTRGHVPACVRALSACHTASPPVLRTPVGVEEQAIHTSVHTSWLRRILRNFSNFARPSGFVMMSATFSSVGTNSGSTIISSTSSRILR